MKPTPITRERVKLFVVYTNSDCTEGRGSEYPIHHCTSEVTALRLGKGGYVMGTDCPIKEEEFNFIAGHYYKDPIKVTLPTDEDNRVAASLTFKRQRTIEKARRLGLSDEEIDLLSGE